MRAGWRQRFAEWRCRRFDHREYDDGNLIACRRCHAALRALAVVPPSGKERGE